MSASASVLQALFPLKNIGGVFANDLAVDGASLDALLAQAQQLLAEMFPDTAARTLSSWERTCGIAPPSGATIQSRRTAVSAQLRARPGDIKRPHFVLLAATLGYTITITPCTPFMSGWGRSGDTIYVADGIYIWNVTVDNVPIYFFQAGQSSAGEPLCSWPEPSGLEELFNDTKPADVFMFFAVSGTVPGAIALAFGNDPLAFGAEPIIFGDGI